MIITIDETASEPLYKQIHDQVIAGIATGQLEPGMSLPSVRSLASDLGINLHTVNKAYAILRDEGYVQMRGRAGAVISEPSDAGRAEKNRETLSAIEDDLFKLALTYRACGGARGEFVESAAAQAARAYARSRAHPRSQVRNAPRRSIQRVHRRKRARSKALRHKARECHANHRSDHARSFGVRSALRSHHRWSHGGYPLPYAEARMLRGDPSPMQHRTIQRSSTSSAPISPS